jgi:hypothetical protein
LIWYFQVIVFIVGGLCELDKWRKPLFIIWLAKTSFTATTTAEKMRFFTVPMIHYRSLFNRYMNWTREFECNFRKMLILTFCFNHLWVKKLKLMQRSALITVWKLFRIFYICLYVFYVNFLLIYSSVKIYVFMSLPMSMFGRTCLFVFLAFLEADCSNIVKYWMEFSQHCQKWLM